MAAGTDIPSGMTTVRTKRPPLRRFGSRRVVVPYLFLLPFGLFFLAFFIVPIIYTIYESFFSEQRSGLGLSAPTVSFAGFANYGAVFSSASFYDGLARVILFGVIQVPVMLGLALSLALLLDLPTIRLRRIFRTAYFLPYAVPSVIAAILWGFLFNPTLSPFTRIFEAFGTHGPNFLSSGTILWSIANIVTWEWTGYNMIIIMSALQAIPPELYEAARLDGASEFSIARRIKIPLIGPALVLTCIFSIIGTLQLFNEPEVLTGVTNSISNSYTPNIFIYNVAFTLNNSYYAAALAATLALITIVFSFGFLFLTRRQAGLQA